MMITIQEINANNLADAGRCDGLFTIDAMLTLSVENDVITYTFIEVSLPIHKRYPTDEVDYKVCIHNPDQAVYLAYQDGQVAGEIRLRRFWNRYAYIDDIVVDIHHRRRGIGTALIEQAKRWAQEKGLAGIILETQNNNVGGCRLYQKCGFELAGFDRRLYHGLNPGTDEIALYWYWLNKAP
jgi:ribosomal protein S18 acetylase RimI-like enzyme